MPQVPPKYPGMSSCANPIIQGHLRQRYGSDNICWAIIWMKEDEILFYTYELTKYCDTNSLSGNRPISIGSRKSYFVDYTASTRVIVPHEELLIPSIKDCYECSYDYIPLSEFNTVDLDYIWIKDKR